MRRPALAALLLLASGMAPMQATLAQTPPAQTPPAQTSPSPSLSPPDAWLPRGSGELILLDKLRGQPTPVTIKTGQSAQFGTLTITLRNCATRPPDLPQNSAAFLDVTDSKGSGPVFRGWILSNTPAVGQIEHPVYDLRLVACR